MDANIDQHNDYIHYVDGILIIGKSHLASKFLDVTGENNATDCSSKVFDLGVC